MVWVKLVPVRDYIFFELTNSLCSKCLAVVEAKVIFQDSNVYLLKNCLEHGLEKVLISNDIEYYKKSRSFLKPGDLPNRFNTKIEKGCPHDCGLCPDHEQHSCVSIVEITDNCNLSCPTCYASSAPNHGAHRSLEEVKAMLDLVLKNEGEPDVVQISGGEPTIHPQFFEILDMAKAMPIKHLMVNTNGIKIAKDRSFAEKLSKYMPGFEIYLQFDSFDDSKLKTLRGEELHESRMKAIEHLNEFKVSTSLVVTLQDGLNNDEIGKIIDFGLKQDCIRGVTFQPTQAAGRLENFDPSKNRITLSEVRKQILKQTNVFEEDDIVPVPCNPDSIAMGYALKLAGEVIPLTRYFKPEDLLAGYKNTINYENLPEIRDKVVELFSTGNSPAESSSILNSLMCCLPKVDLPNLNYSNLFRVLILQFYDVYNFDVRGVKKSCVHIVSKDGRMIPFDTMNIFYRKEIMENLVNV